MHQPFQAMAQGSYCDYEILVTHSHTNTYGDMLTVCASEEVIYITKAQAMEFFGLVDAASIDRIDNLKYP